MKARLEMETDLLKNPFTIEVVQKGINGMKNGKLAGDGRVADRTNQTLSP